MYKISVIVPTYNVELYLEQALDSLVNQTIFDDLEVIIVNDGSTDNSPIIAKQYVDKYNNIKLVSQENGGYGVAMNTGLSLATGEYIGILEPDDFLSSQMYEDLYSLAEKHSHNVPIIRATSIYKVWLKDGKKIDTIAISKIVDTRLPFYANDYVINCDYLNIQIYNTPPAIWSAIYKRNFIEENQIKFSTIKAGYQDKPFFIETIFCADRIALLNDAYYFYRVDREGSSSARDSSSKGFSLFGLRQFEIEQLKRHNHAKANLLANNMLTLFYQIFLWGYMKLISEEKKIEYLNQIKSFIKNFADCNVDTYNIKIFDEFKYIGDKKYNDVEILMIKGADYFNNKLKYKGYVKLNKLVMFILKLMKQPLFFIIAITRLIINLVSQIIILTINLRIKNGS